MPRLKKATDASGVVFYPITISKGVYDTDRNQRLSQTLDDVEYKTPVVSCTVAQLPSSSTRLAVNTYYNITSTVSSATLYLPAVSDSTHLSAIGVFFTTGSSTPTLTITPSSGDTVSYFSGYAIEASKTYELNIIWNGTKWIVAYATID